MSKDEIKEIKNLFFSDSNRTKTSKSSKNKCDNKEYTKSKKESQNFKSYNFDNDKEDLKESLNINRKDKDVKNNEMSSEHFDQINKLIENMDFKNLEFSKDFYNWNRKIMDLISKNSDLKLIRDLIENNEESIFYLEEEFLKNNSINSNFTLNLKNHYKCLSSKQQTYIIIYLRKVLSIFKHMIFDSIPKAKASDVTKTDFLSKKRNINCILENDKKLPHEEEKIRKKSRSHSKNRDRIQTRNEDRSKISKRVKRKSLSKSPDKNEKKVKVLRIEDIEDLKSNEFHKIQDKKKRKSENQNAFKEKVDNSDLNKRISKTSELDKIDSESSTTISHNKKKVETHLLTLDDLEEF